MASLQLNITGCTNFTTSVSGSHTPSGGVITGLTPTEVQCFIACPGEWFSLSLAYTTATAVGILVPMLNGTPVLTSITLNGNTYTPTGNILIIPIANEIDASSIIAPPEMYLITG